MRPGRAAAQAPRFSLARVPARPGPSAAACSAPAGTCVRAPPAERTARRTNGDRLSTTSTNHRARHAPGGGACSYGDVLGGPGPAASQLLAPPLPCSDSAPRMGPASSRLLPNPSSSSRLAASACCRTKAHLSKQLRHKTERDTWQVTSLRFFFPRYFVNKVLCRSG